MIAATQRSLGSDGDSRGSEEPTGVTERLRLLTNQRLKQQPVIKM